MTHFQTRLGERTDRRGKWVSPVSLPESTRMLSPAPLLTAYPLVPPHTATGLFFRSSAWGSCSTTRVGENGNVIAFCCKTGSSAAARAKRAGHPAQGPDLQKGGETAWCMLLTAVVAEQARKYWAVCPRARGRASSVKWHDRCRRPAPEH